jgi:hypothetical protein
MKKSDCGVGLGKAVVLPAPTSKLAGIPFARYPTLCKSAKDGAPGTWLVASGLR